MIVRRQEMNVNRHKKTLYVSLHFLIICNLLVPILFCDYLPRLFFMWCRSGPFVLLLTSTFPGIEQQHKQHPCFLFLISAPVRYHTGNASVGRIINAAAARSGMQGPDWPLGQRASAAYGFFFSERSPLVYPVVAIAHVKRPSYCQLLSSEHNETLQRWMTVTLPATLQTYS